MIDEVLKRAAKRLVPSKGRTKDQRKREIFLLLDYLMTQEERLIPAGIASPVVALASVMKEVQALPDWRKTLESIKAQAAYESEQGDDYFDMEDGGYVLASSPDGRLLPTDLTFECNDVIVDDMGAKDPRTRVYLATTTNGKYLLREEYCGYQETRVFSKEELIEYVFRDLPHPADLYLLWVHYLVDVQEGFNQEPKNVAA